MTQYRVHYHNHSDFNNTAQDVVKAENPIEAIRKSIANFVRAGSIRMVGTDPPDIDPFGGLDIEVYRISSTLDKDHFRKMLESFVVRVEMI